MNFNQTLSNSLSEMSSNQNNIYRTAKPLYYLCKFSGFACFSIKGNIEDGQIHCKFYDVLLLLLFSGFYINNIVMSLEIDSYYGSSVILDIGNYGRLLISLIAGLIFVVTCFLQRHSIWSILQSLDQFDEDIELLGISINQKTHKKFLIRFIVATGFLKGVHISFLLYGAEKPTLKHFFFIYLPNFSFFIQIGSIQLILISIYLRQNHLIRCVENVFHLKKGNVKYIRSNGIGQTINSISNLYDKINDAVDAFNKSYSFISVIVFSLYFAYAVFSVFMTSRSVGYREVTVIAIMKTLFLTFFFTSYVLAALHFASKVAERVCIVKVV